MIALCIHPSGKTAENDTYWIHASVGVMVSVDQVADCFSVPIDRVMRAFSRSRHWYIAVIVTLDHSGAVSEDAVSRVERSAKNHASRLICVSDT